MRRIALAGCLAMPRWLSSRRIRPDEPKMSWKCSWEAMEMLSVRAFAATALSSALFLLAVSSAAPAAEQPKSGGMLRMYHRDSPGSASIHEGASYSFNIPLMPIFNNLVIYDQHIAQ